MCKDVKSFRLFGVRIGSDWSGLVWKGADDEDEDENEDDEEADGATKC